VGCFALFIVLITLTGCPQRNAPRRPVDDSQGINEDSVESKNETSEKEYRNASIPSLSPRILSNREPKANDWFEDVASDVKLDFVYDDSSASGFYQLIESIGGGIAWSDFDCDGWQDVWVTGGGDLSVVMGKLKASGQPSGLFRNRNGATFQALGNVAFHDTAPFYSHGCTVADLDHDGFDDVLVAGFEGVQFWQNLGDGTFEEMSASLEFESSIWNITPVAADYDNDGLLDIYLLTYADWHPDAERKCKNDQGVRDVCGPSIFPGQRDIIFHNTGEQFENVSEQFDLFDENRGLGVVGVDFDQNGFIDFAVVNDVHQNQLYFNEDGTSFEEQGVLAGMAFSINGGREGSMGIDIGDFDRNGKADLWYCNYARQDNSLLQNMDGTGFLNVTDKYRLGGVSFPWVGFGTGFADFDGDGWEDLFVINGHVAYEWLDSPFYQPAQLFQNVSGTEFREIKDDAGAYFETPRSGRGSATVDYDNDGDLDLSVLHQNEPMVLLKNRHAEKPWVRVQLIGTKSDRNAVGASARIETSAGPLVRWRRAGGNYLSHSDERLLFALTEDGPVDVTITWLGGQQELFENLTLRQTHLLVEGSGTHVSAQN